MSENIEAAPSNIANGSSQHHKKAGLAAMMVAALGVVYGDIGTSPLYAFKESINPEHGVPFSQANTLGVVSLLLWSVIIIVTIQYVTFIMRADNKGEGGILALMALALRSTTRESYTGRILVALGVFGCCMLFGDAVITPAVSVLSAVEGLELVTPTFKPLVIPLTIGILAGLFLIQKHGTATVGNMFGPVMILWFLSIGVIGLANVVSGPVIFHAINPLLGIQFIFEHGWHAFVVLGSVVLVVTGCEAMYLDMGHFGPKPLRRAWNMLVLPCLVLNYLGQGAFVLANPKAVSNPFFLSAPDWALIPLVILATVATVIASQAVISGAFSLASQAIQLGFAPRMKVDHTSSAEIGQIYMPVINWLLFAIIVFVVTNFKTSSDLAAAYGIAVTSTMVITSLIFTFVMARVWGWSLWVALPVGTLFLVCNGTFLAANLLKIKDGGWFPLMLGSLVFFLMMTWHRGRMLQRERAVVEGIPLIPFVQGLLAHPPTRVEGTAVFLAGSIEHVPVALLHNLKHNRVLHQRNVFLKFSIFDVPFIDDKDRISWNQIGENTFTLRASYGFKETPDVHTVMALAEKQNNITFELMDTSFFLARDTVVPSKLPGMAVWRERLYGWMHQNGAKPSDFFQIPANRVVELGTKIEI